MCSATWPPYVRLRKALWGRSALAALAMTVLLILLVIGPALLLAVNLTDNVAALLDRSKAMLMGGPMKPPAWIREIPWVGGMLADYWQRLASSGDSLITQWNGLLVPARNFVLGAGQAAGDGLLQLMLAGFIGFFSIAMAKTRCLPYASCLPGLPATSARPCGKRSTAR